ncbi:hypothetical protein [Streptomonospora litoralis]|uniref:Uncharacterized protein n=1 Tax=Streptomonospora litoralis TaxID=2498135 RepID=A0A4P6PWB6_9ACTN|nr:hypothetical protein [Streptomonospora litoralis]QBI52458.1 hypothetical protein EKD16_03235 [Streptomonospora litoralis]
MLRHLIGLLAGTAAAPALWIALAWSAGRVSATAEGGEGFGGPLSLTAVGVLMAVGIACGFLAGARVSPLAAFCCGGLVLGYALWPVLAPGSADALLPGWIPDDSAFHPLGPGLLLALPLGTLLFISSLVPSRWRSRRAAPAPQEPADEVYGPRTEHAPEPVGPPITAPGPSEGGGSAPGPEPQGDPDKTTTPMRRRRVGRPRWAATSPEPESDTLQFQRDERR